MPICNHHPGGAVELPASAFYPSDQARKEVPCKECRNRLAKERNRREVTVARASTNGTRSNGKSPTVAAKPTTAKHGRLQIGGYYLHPDCILIVDTLQDGKVVLHTSIIEIEPESKHPRNKKLIFTRQHAPSEYAAIVAWLGGNTPPPASDAERDAALQLAEEAEKKLAAAQLRIEELESAIAPLRALIGK